MWYPLPEQFLCFAIIYWLFSGLWNEHLADLMIASNSRKFPCTFYWSYLAFCTANKNIHQTYLVFTPLKVKGNKRWQWQRLFLQAVCWWILEIITTSCAVYAPFTLTLSRSTDDEIWDVDLSYCNKIISNSSTEPQCD